MRIGLTKLKQFSYDSAGNNVKFPKALLNQMKFTIILLFALISTGGHTQEIFTYEKEADSLKVHTHDEITFTNTIDKITLSGTIIKPKDGFTKIAIIVPGSGRDTRHSHYIIAEKLVNAGIAVFRFDERGLGKSTGQYSELAGTLSRDLSAAFTAVKEKFSDKKIGIIGHSLGGVAALEAVQKGLEPEFLVLIETPAIKNGAFIMNQITMNYENALPEVMRKGKSKEEVVAFLNALFTYVRDTPRSNSEIKKFIKARGFDKKFAAVLNDDFLMEMLHTNLEATLRDTGIPTLYLTGTMDKVINHSDETSLVQSFSNPNIEIGIFDGLNHWLTIKDAPVGSSLYNMDPEPLARILNWATAL